MSLFAVHSVQFRQVNLEKINKACKIIFFKSNLPVLFSWLDPWAPKTLQGSALSSQAEVERGNRTGQRSQRFWNTQDILQ